MIVRHFIIGLLNLKQGLAFVSWHIERHLGQVETLVNDGQFPGA